MKYLSIALLGACFTLSANSAELLGKISDETATPQEQNAQPVTHQNPTVTYRVICAEGETSPECGQPPVEDSLDLRPGSKQSSNVKQQKK